MKKIMPEKITKKDIELLSHIYRFKTVTVAQLSALTGRSEQVIRRRLRTFFEKGLISKIRGYGRSRGRPEDIICITETGHNILLQQGILADKSSFQEEYISNPIFVYHDLLANWFYIHLLHIEKTIPEISVQYLSSNLNPLPQKSSDCHTLLERIQDKNNSEQFVEFFPDAVFSIRNSETKKALLFFLEADRGKEVLASMHRGSKDIRQKIINYKSLFKSHQYKHYEKVFDENFTGFRLLFLANTVSRFSALCRLVQAMPPSDFIWLTDYEQMSALGLSAKIWSRGGRNGDASHSILGPKFTCDSPIM